jgi:repressor LexA
MTPNISSYLRRKNMHHTTKKILDAITGLAAENGSPPTLREIAHEAGLSSTWPVRYHLKKLADKGYIKMKKNLSRGIELLRPTTGIPLLGRISAGKPIDVVENVDEYINSVTDVFGARNVFALRIKGDSMEGAGIFNNDIVFVQKQAKAENGEIVAALLGSEATVKRYHVTKEGITLVAENPAYEPIISKDVIVLGKVIGSMRKLG